ncbi:hypothetical protein PV08_02137 [Exophiala spinifera]|uniref:Zn(2)-C6 fungal-type domain-containing protein n=1 Tax=Exophiala spinifera TaxID=91928 RepID=A0A0D2A9Y9_9EURO|nr:uncharacterized protein PV08_02137 [Exophiala spinifera]KIW21557.1 hypothetical protein PV08_02137 [Exophiala spinifera]
MASSGPSNRNTSRVSASEDDASAVHTQPDPTELDLAESPPADDGPPEPPQSARSRARSSQACVMCQQKKIRCTGTQPCENCQRRRWSCRFNADGDGRRKTTNHRIVQELNDAKEQVSRHRQMISGIFAIVRVGEPEIIREFFDEVRQTEKVNDVANFVRAKVDDDERLREAFQRVDWGPDAQL